MQRTVLISLVCCMLISFSAPQPEQYRCLPCGQECDNTTYSKPGSCPSCHMELVKASTVSFRTMQPTDVCSYIQAHPNLMLLDVRTRGEFDGTVSPHYGTLKGAINIPIQQLQERMHELEKYKDREILVFCSHSHRSPRASHMLVTAGYKKVINMAGGMSVFRGNCKK